MDSSPQAGPLGSGRAVEGGGMEGAAGGSPTAEGDGVKVEVSAMVPLWSLLQRQRGREEQSELHRYNTWQHRF